MWRFYFCLPFLLLFVISFVSSAQSIPAIFFPSQIGVEDSLAYDSPICSAPDPNLNYKPVIGILTHPGDGRWDIRLLHSLSYDTNISYIAASYVKLAETGGARVIPLIYNEPEELLFQKLELVNGVIFTGGWAKTGLYYNIVKKIFYKVLEKNDAGEHFPVYAMCLGFEILSMIISQNRDILEKFNSVNYPSSLQFYENVNIQTTVFQRFPPELLKKLSTDCLVMQNHHIYVSTIQSKQYPVTAFQWHPEKNAFEWGSSEIPHSEEAIQVTQHAANYLVSEARKSMNRPSSKKVLSNLIHNYKPTYSGYKGTGDDEVYIFM